MKMMTMRKNEKSRKLLAVLLVSLLLLMCLTGCGSEKVESSYLDINLDDYIEINTDYLNFTYEEPTDIEITDEEIESAIQLALEDAAVETENADGLTKDGDKLDISYVAVNDDGETITESDGYSITLGKDYLQEDLQEALIGHRVGDVVEVKTKISDDFSYDESLQGQNVTYKITIQKKYDVTVPGLDVDFVKANSAADTVGEYRELVKQQLYDSKVEDALQEIYDEFWDEIVENAKVLTDYPEDLLESEEEYFYGYVNYLGYTEEDADFDTLSAEYAEDAVKQKLVLYKIASDNDLIPTEDEFQDYATEEIESNGYDEESFQETFVYDSYTYGLQYGWLEDYLDEQVKDLIMKL